MNIWKILGIEPTQDVKVIRRRYAELVRLYHPEDQPELYQEIKEKQDALARYKINAQETEVYRFLIEKANRLYSMILGLKREELMTSTRQFEEEVKHSSIHHLPKIYQAFSSYLELLERGL